MFLHIPWESKDYLFNGLEPKRPPCFGRDLLHQQFHATIMLMVLDLQGIYMDGGLMVVLISRFVEVFRVHIFKPIG